MQRGASGWIVLLLSCIPLACFSAHNTPKVDVAKAVPGDIYTWAQNTATWNQNLHVSGYRIGCAAGDVVQCFNDGASAAAEGRIKTIIVSLELDPEHAAGDALACSQLSLSYPALTEVTFDDFIDRYGLILANEATPQTNWLEGVVQNVKAKNPALRFGVTLYEDDLGSPYLTPTYLPADVAALVDNIHLYLHYREDIRDFPSYVAKVKSLFPNAKIVAGSYAYDRVNYIPCSPSAETACSPEQDIALYKQSIEMESTMLKDGTIAAIEFYPGFFGLEEQWQGWEQSDYCDQARLQQCIENTLKMREDAVTNLRSTMNWGSPAVETVRPPRREQ